MDLVLYKLVFDSNKSVVPVRVMLIQKLQNIADQCFSTCMMYIFLIFHTCTNAVLNIY